MGDAGTDGSAGCVWLAGIDGGDTGVLAYLDWDECDSHNSDSCHPLPGTSVHMACKCTPAQPHFHQLHVIFHEQDGESGWESRICNCVGA
jgi:hypothetical protein